MSRSQTSASDANNGTSSFRQASYDQGSWGPLCNCGRSTLVLKSWTLENPGRRFYRCGVHGFVSWADAEKPQGWQKVSLLEARDEIQRYKDEIKALKEEMKELKQSLRALNHQQIEELKIQKNSKFNRKEEEEKIADEVSGSKEREKLLRQFIVVSWGGFILVIALIVAMMK